MLVRSANCFFQFFAGCDEVLRWRRNWYLNLMVNQYRNPKSSIKKKQFAPKLTNTVPLQCEKLVLTYTIVFWIFDDLVVDQRCRSKVAGLLLKCRLE